MSKSFTYYSDPSHGWICVSLDDLRYLGLAAHDFSMYSYRNGNELYLEEDMDAMKFIHAFNEKNKESPIIIEQHLKSTANFIRRMPHNTHKAKVGAY